MKLKLPAVFSQRNPIWSSDLLGYNTNPVYSIGGFGCLITSFGMYVNEQPNNVNKKLQDNGGYVAGGGNFIWSKCSVLGLTQVYQSPYYSDAVTTQGLAKMRALLDEGRPLITHIDFDPRDPDDDQHWILVYGYEDNDVFLAADPWTGTLINLDVYGGVKRAVLEWRSYDKILPKDEGVDCQKLLQQAVDDRNRNWDLYQGLCDLLGTGTNYEVAHAQLEKLVGIEDVVRAKDKTIEDLNTKIKSMETELSQQWTELQTTIAELDNKGSLLEEAIQGNLSMQKKVQTLTTANETLQKSVQELRTQVQQQTVTFKGWRLRVYNFLLGR